MLEVDILKDEERLIVNCLSLYHTLRIEQIIKLIEHKDEEVAMRILRNLIKRQIIIYNQPYFSLDMQCQPDNDTIKAFWVLLKWMPKLDKKLKDEIHNRAKFPANIYFLSNNSQYEIVVVNEGNESILNMLFATERESSQEPEDMLTYIIVVDDDDSREECLKRIPDSYIENNRIIFAEVEYESSLDRFPSVTFYRVNA